VELIITSMSWNWIKTLFVCFSKKMIFSLKINFFSVFFYDSFDADVKNEFLIFRKQKNIVLMHFQAKNTLKNKHYHNAKHYLSC
jgi:hypothetical protein